MNNKWIYRSLGSMVACFSVPSAWSAGTAFAPVGSWLSVGTGIAGVGFAGAGVTLRTDSGVDRQRDAAPSGRPGDLLGCRDAVFRLAGHRQRGAIFHHAVPAARRRVEANNPLRQAVAQTGEGRGQATARGHRRWPGSSAGGAAGRTADAAGS
jgi:hypothetical protein